MSILEILQTNPSSIKTVTVSTVVKLRKTQDETRVVDGVEKKVRVENPHFGKVNKIVTDMEVVIGSNYQEEVNKQLEKEGKDSSFVSNPRKWGIRVGDSCLIEHKGNMYVDMIVKSSGEVSYEYDGEEISKQDIIGLSTPNSSYSRQGTDDEVVVRTIKLDNIDGCQVERSTDIGSFTLDQLDINVE